jgi:hypothetical protein
MPVQASGIDEDEAAFQRLRNAITPNEQAYASDADEQPSVEEISALRTVLQKYKFLAKRVLELEEKRKLRNEWVRCWMINTLCQLL